MSAPDFSKFPAPQRAAYLGAIAALVTADRDPGDAEVQFLSALAQHTGLTQDQSQQVVNAALDPSSGALEKNLAQLKTSDLRFSLMHDLVAFAQSDGDYTDEERKRVASMAASLGLTQEQFDAVDQFQEAKASGEDTSAASGLMGQLGMPKSGGMLAGILATVGPMILQQLLSRGGQAGALGANAGGGMMGILNQVLGAMGGGQGAPPQTSAPGGGGGLMDILGQVMGGAGNAGSPQAQAGGSAMGGLGQILQVLGQMKGGGAQPSAPPSGGGYDAVSGLLGKLFGGR